MNVEVLNEWRGVISSVQSTKTHILLLTNLKAKKLRLIMTNSMEINVCVCRMSQWNRGSSEVM